MVSWLSAPATVVIQTEPIVEWQQAIIWRVHYNIKLVLLFFHVVHVLYAQARMSGGRGKGEQQLVGSAAD